ncbi:hypothetical protein AS593_06550 [Caulobacter vibrioides]|nr:hypothetical protein AS593_06550 [Caulobacter vibrioides]
MSSTASDLSARLAARAEAVCRRYLSKGRRDGAYWRVGDVDNTPGQSLFVRLEGPTAGQGAAGRWRDAATGQHGDLLDLIGLALRHDRIVDTFDEARRFLSLPDPVADAAPEHAHARASTGLGERGQIAARRLLDRAGSILGTLAQSYLAGRALHPPPHSAPLTFLPRCRYRPASTDAPHVRTSWPALLARVTDLSGATTGVHRTWLDPATCGKAPVATPRRTLGAIHGHAVRFGRPDLVLAAGEGLETVLSVGSVAPRLPLAAALSSAHLAALQLPPGLRRLYILVDPDPAGNAATEALSARAIEVGVLPLRLDPLCGDHNDDLLQLGAKAFAESLLTGLTPEDAETFLDLGNIR